MPFHPTALPHLRKAAPARHRQPCARPHRAGGAAHAPARRHAHSTGAPGSAQRVRPHARLRKVPLLQERLRRVLHCSAGDAAASALAARRRPSSARPPGRTDGLSDGRGV
eukprot:358390-Chlamydomonas_euryale.AAC.2